ncbi:hypothetical protein P7K49_017112, partial [Saguinus oedipus]
VLSVAAPSGGKAEGSSGLCVRFHADAQQCGGADQAQQTSSTLGWRPGQGWCHGSRLQAHVSSEGPQKASEPTRGSSTGFKELCE